MKTEQELRDLFVEVLTNKYPVVYMDRPPIWVEGGGYFFSPRTQDQWEWFKSGAALAPSVPQVCPNCEEMRRLIIEGAKYAYIYSWSPPLDRIHGMEKAMKQAEEESVTRPGLKNWETMLRPDMLAALSTLQVQVGGENAQ